MFCLFFIFRIWDLSLEKDEEEEAEFKAKMKEQVNVPQDLPPQLLFVHQVFITFHLFCARVVGLLKLVELADLSSVLFWDEQGQKGLKELHWHTQIPGMVISTAADGFNVLMPANIDTTLPSTDA
ncbi:hypothetical protein BHE74_00038521 [Ensete ventricosum]|nr:hypothetical protein GW17_00038633 [Ensete ventricosum]RWW54878.1 hypothetical protein BHE74_00038521 [Ensete ventricosum]